MTIHNPPRVLILDAEKVISDTLCMVLNQSGYQARPVYGHVEAVAVAREFEPDVFLAEMFNRWDFNGCETAAELRTFLPEVRVAICSGSATAAPIYEDFRRRGYDFDIFAKPVHPNDLIARMRLYCSPGPIELPSIPLPRPPEPPEPRGFRGFLKRLGN